MTKQLAFFSDPLDAKFLEFDAANPHVWDLFCRLVDRAIAAGQRRWSADAICHLIRWHYVVETRSDCGFRLNDHHVTFYARRWVAAHPERASFFQIKTRRLL